jgi:beta-galactosidase
MGQFRCSKVTRRLFLKSSALVLASATLKRSSIAQLRAAGNTPTETHRVLTAWEYHRGPLASVWDVWRKDMETTIAWRAVEIPHCFNGRDAVDPDEPFYEGQGWYRSSLKLANPFNKGRTLVHFEGAGQKCEVYVGLDTVDQHVGGYDEFVVDITDAVNKSDVETAEAGTSLAVRCDNSPDAELIPSRLNDFHRFGGLYRNVSLLYVPAVSLDRIHIDVEMRPSRPATISVKGRLYNPGRLGDEVRLLIRVSDPGGSVIRSSEKHGAPWEGWGEIANFQVDAPQLWSPSRPALYGCEVTLASAHGTTSATERFGFRYFEFTDHGPFKLNGECLLLKGTHREEDHAGVGAAMSTELIRREMELIKDMGANFVRLGHHQQSRAVLDCCDELGLLVLEEIPWSRGGLGGNGYKQHAREMLRAMIDQHYNHPCVILWGLGNEDDWPGDFPNYDKESIQGFVKELNDQAHAADPGRRTFLRRCDFCRDLVDVYSPSIWAGWYQGPYTQYRKRIEKEMGAVRHFLHVEWGAESHRGRYSEDVDRQLVKFLSGQFSENDRERLLTGGQLAAAREGDWSETYACNLFDWHLKEQENIPQLAGSAQWIFKDFSTPLRPDNPIPYVNQKGVAERDLTLKDGYYVFQSYWAEKPMIRIHGHSWSTRWGTSDELKLVKAYSNCEEAELLLNGVSQGVKKRNSQDFPAAGLHWLVKFKPGQNQLRALGHRKGISVEDELSFVYQVQSWGPPKRIDLREVSRDGGKVTVEARFLDERNSLCLDRRDRILFGLMGDGTLLDDTGTSSGSRRVELANARAEISLLTGGGTSVIGVRAKSLPTAFLKVT